MRGWVEFSSPENDYPEMKKEAKNYITKQKHNESNNKQKRGVP